MSPISRPTFFVKIWVLALISVFTFLSVSILGQDGSLTKYKRFEKETVFINRIDKNGTLYCEEVKNEITTINNTLAACNLQILTCLRKRDPIVKLG